MKGSEGGALRTRQDDGFTLIELLLTITIISAVSLALGNAMLGFVKNTDTTTRRLSESHDAQISAAYFAQDVASIGVRSTTAPNPLLQSVETTGSALACGTGTTVVRFGWDDPSSATAATLVKVAYVVQTVAGERQLHRLVCLGASTTASTDVVLAHNLDTTAPTVTCSSSCPASPAVPQSVTLVVYIKDPLSTGPTYTITLTGQRRQT